MRRVPTNLRPLGRSKPPERPGEIFVLSVHEHEYYWGKVISLDAYIGFEGVILAYIYDTKSDSTDPIPKLSPDVLLIPPFAINDLPWNLGYFYTVGCQPLTPDDVLNQHCFYSLNQKQYFDERRNRLEKRVEPCGAWSLASYRTIDDEVSRALGIPLAPEE